MPTTIHGTNGITFNDGSTQNTRAPSAFKNRLINGDMRIDQRSSGAAFSVGTGAVYGSCDRWGSLAGASGVWTQRRTATTLTDFPFGMRIQRTAGSTSTTACYIGQVIETTNCADLAGQSVTLSFDAIAGANFSAASSIVTVELWSGTGTDQGWGSLNSATWSSQSTILNVSQSITTTKTRYSFTAAVPSGINELAVRFYAVGTGTAGASDFFEITGVQLEAGSTATDFERRPIGTELALCQRYFQKTYDIETAQATATNLGMVYVGSTAAVVWGLGGAQYIFNMRSIPSINYWDGAGNASKCSYIVNNSGSTSFVANTNLNSAPYNISTRGFLVGSNIVANSGSYIHYTANSEL